MVQPVPIPVEVKEVFEYLGYTPAIVTAPPGPQELEFGLVEALYSPCPIGDNGATPAHTHCFSILCAFNPHEIETLQTNGGRFWLSIQGEIPPFFLSSFNFDIDA